MTRQSSLHHGVYLVAGFLITVVALIVITTGATDTPEAMQLFATIGGVFILIGLTKWLIKKMQDIKQGEKKLENKIAGVNLQQKEPARQTIHPCSRCQTANYSTSNYCHMCGTRLR